MDQVIHMFLLAECRGIILPVISLFFVRWNHPLILSPESEPHYHPGSILSLLPLMVLGQVESRQPTRLHGGTAGRP